jgi:glycosyltransferase involved in cell wall biosynthesis
LRGVKIFVRDEVQEFSRIRGPVRRLAKRVLFGGLRQAVDCFLAIGSSNRNYYLSMGVDPRRIITMPYAVDNSFFQTRCRQESKRREQFRTQLGLEPNRPVILYTGKLYGRKRPEDLLEAYARLSKDGREEPGPYLLYVGDGQSRSALEARAASLGWSSVKFVGFKNQTELPAFFDLCDVFVIPSSLEPWGLIVNEAMNAGRPIIASDHVGACQDLLRDGINGYSYPAEDVGELHRVLLKFLAEPGRHAKMGQASLSVIKQWSYEEDVEALKEALDNFVHRCFVAKSA